LAAYTAGLDRIQHFEKMTGSSICKYPAATRFVLHRVMTAALGLAFAGYSFAQAVQAPAANIATNSNQSSLAHAGRRPLRLADTQASTYQTAILNERIAAEDVKQARAAFLPKVSAPLGYIYTSPAQGLPPGEPRAPSFIASDAIGAYEALANVSGDLDIAGKLRATLQKNRALLAAAHAGTEVAKRALALAVIESYYGLALAIAPEPGRGRKPDSGPGI
jgi:outer membrane protein TolC